MDQAFSVRSSFGRTGAEVEKERWNCEVLEKWNNGVMEVWDSGIIYK